MKESFSWAQLTAGIYATVACGQGLHRALPHCVKRARKLRQPFPQTEGERSSHDKVSPTNSGARPETNHPSEQHQSHHKG
jgi:hypothetical protein